ncbi:hypothetical protein [Pseudonocardia sp. ICBG1293]|uniref:hypothetical protein n=1 Tax=Pseudonocardia sp. ICBG1293 TaxID=2844382 RepID=UPI001CC96F4C|nr:hypothetical protein [Pseudonocardia sp. ICBG1293]
MTAVAERTGRTAPRRLARRPRAAVRTAHVLLAAAWTGASLVMLVLPAAVLLQGADAGFAVAVMATVGNGVIPFLAVGTVLSGAVLGLGTAWGLFRHRWVVAKTALALAVIVSSVALSTGWIDAAGAGDRSVLPLLVAAAVLHQVMLLGATVLSVEKPGGRLRRRRLTGNQKVA